MGRVAIIDAGAEEEEVKIEIEITSLFLKPEKTAYVELTIWLLSWNISWHSRLSRLGGWTGFPSLVSWPSIFG
jgi:hypothetical protein